MMNYSMPSVRCQAAKKSSRDRILMELYTIPRSITEALVDSLNMCPATVSEQQMFSLNWDMLKHY